VQTHLNGFSSRCVQTCIPEACQQLQSHLRMHSQQLLLRVLLRHGTDPQLHALLHCPNALPCPHAYTTLTVPHARVAGEYSIAIMGDLHLEPAQMHLFHAARDHLTAAMAASPGRVHPGARVVQLGDLGGYKHKPGGQAMENRPCSHTSVTAHAGQYTGNWQ
jgi:hypothetical protein